MTDKKRIVEVREKLAERIYMDWNQSDETWQELPEYRKDSYRLWVGENVIKEPMLGIIDPDQSTPISTDVLSATVEANNLVRLGFNCCRRDMRASNFVKLIREG